MGTKRCSKGDGVLFRELIKQEVVRKERELTELERRKDTEDDERRPSLAKAHSILPTAFFDLSTALTEYGLTVFY